MLDLKRGSIIVICKLDWEFSVFFNILNVQILMSAANHG